MTHVEKCLVELISDPATISVICHDSGTKVELPDKRTGDVVIQYWENVEGRNRAMVLVALPTAKNPIVLVRWPMAATRYLG